MDGWICLTGVYKVYVFVNRYCSGGGVFHPAGDVLLCSVSCWLLRAGHFSSMQSMCDV